MRRYTWVKPLALWSCFAAAHFGLGCLLYHQLLPEPRWQLEGEFTYIWTKGMNDRLLTLADTPGTVTLRDANTGKEICTVARDCLGGNSHDDCITLAQSGQFFAATDKSRHLVSIVAVADGKKREVIHPPDDEVSYCLPSPDGKLVFLTLLNFKSKHLHSRLIEIDSGHTEFELQEAEQGVVFLYPGQIAISVHHDGNDLWKLWDIRQKRWVLEHQKYRPVAANLDPQCAHLVPVLGLVTLDDEGGNSPTPWQLRDAVTLEPILDGPAGTTNLGLECSPDARYCALIYERPHEAHFVDVWDIAAKRYVVRMRSQERCTLGFSPDGSRLLTCEARGDANSSELKVFDLVTGESLWACHSPNSLVTNAAPVLTSDGLMVVSWYSRDLVVHLEARDARSGLLMDKRVLHPFNCCIASMQCNGELHVLSSIAPLRPGKCTQLEWTDWLPWLGLRVEREHEPIWSVFDARRHILDRPRFLRNAYVVNVLPDRRLLSYHWRDSKCLACWDYPGHGPWRCVLGIPFGVASMLLLLRWVIRLRSQAGEDWPSNPPLKAEASA